MSFINFKKRKQKHVGKMMKDNSHLFVVDLDKDVLWELYLDSFPEGTNEIYRELREYDCSCCRGYVKNFGNVVSIVNGVVTTMWDFNANDPTFQPVINALSQYVKSCTVRDVFVTTEKAFGANKNFEELEDGTVASYDHFRVDLLSKFITNKSTSPATIMGKFRTTKEVFNRSLNEISSDAVETVLDLIAQKSLYKGAEWKANLNTFLKLHTEFHKLPPEVQNNYCWTKSLEVGPVIGKIKNHSIGVLLSDIASGMDLDVAVKRYEKIVAPTNYKRPKAIFTKKMIEQAKKTVEELGLADSLSRRFAMVDDITVNNILFANRDTLKDMGEDVFDELQQDVPTDIKKFNKLEEVSIDHFVKEILPRTNSMEVLFENRLQSNLVSLIAPQSKDSPSMFKWNNGFSWAYNGNITDSMKERVKAAGGKVDGVLRFSIQWNEENDNRDDLDAHCKEPNGGSHIYFQNNGHRHRSSGMLDVDIVDPGSKIAVENITYSDVSRMPVGTYQMMVHNYSGRGAKSGFSAEIEFNGETHAFEHSKPVRGGAYIDVAEVKLDANGNFSIGKSLSRTTSTKQIWGLPSNQFHPVAVNMMSPNYWDEQSGIGNKHYFFMLKNCKNENKPNGFFNEFLKEDLLEHKRVFEALGSKMYVKDNSNQLSGLGFSVTQRNSIIVKIDGHLTRMLKINF